MEEKKRSEKIMNVKKKEGRRTAERVIYHPVIFPRAKNKNKRTCMILYRGERKKYTRLYTEKSLGMARVKKIYT